MATRAYTPEAVVSLPPVLAFALGVPAAPRSAVESVIERMIEALDQIDGDPELEEDSEDCGGDEGEPDFRRRRRYRRNQSGPGCTISDSDYAVDDVACDPESEAAI
jgi:hypothetical protein